MTNILSPGINGQILLALQTIFTLELQTNLLAVGDPLACKVIKEADLQDDPTQVAPFLVFREDINKGTVRMPKDMEAQYGPPEIGGPIKYIHYFEGNFGLPLAPTRATQRVNTDTLAGRIQAVLEAYYDLANVVGQGPLSSPDGTQVIEGANDLLIDDIQTSIFGGEQTFYGKGSVYWHYPVSSYRIQRGMPPF